MRVPVSRRIGHASRGLGGRPSTLPPVRSRLLLLPLVVVAASGCGSSGDGPALAVEVSLTSEYPDGAVHVVRVERPDGEQVVERTLPEAKRASLKLKPGRYRLLAYQRPCPAAAGCAEPGDPVDICGRYFTIEEDKPATARIEVTPEEGCSIEFS